MEISVTVGPAWSGPGGPVRVLPGSLVRHLPSQPSLWACVRWSHFGPSSELTSSERSG